MIDMIYVEARESNSSIAARYPHLLEAAPGGLRYIGQEQTVAFCCMDDARAAMNGALRRFVRGG